MTAPSAHATASEATREGAERRSRLAAARLYLVCPARPPRGELEPLLRAAIAGGVQMVQLRDKELRDGELAEAAARAHELCAAHGVLLIVNDRPAVALAAGADGVHLGQEDLPVAEARSLLGERLLVGLSTHAPAEIDAAGRGGPGRAPDYIGVGPVFATPTKPGRPAVGTELVRYAAVRARVPFFAIGGIDPQTIGDVLAAGARRVAVVRAIAEAQRPEAAARSLRDALGRADGARAHGEHAGEARERAVAAG
jgi:thiamine-phosphate pyrophosphorylase